MADVVRLHGRNGWQALVTPPVVRGVRGHWNLHHPDPSVAVGHGSIHGWADTYAQAEADAYAAMEQVARQDDEMRASTAAREARDAEVWATSDNPWIDHARHLLSIEEPEF